jgi:hypothetical protein
MDREKKNRVSQLLNNFKPVSLPEIECVSLMNRVDKKFILSFEDLLHIIPELKQNYAVLTIEGQRVFTYKTDYYDTPDLNMFIDHHNGKLNRYKIRQRKYIESDLEFLEIKFKNNKGQTLKKRIKNNHIHSDDAVQLISESTPYDPKLLGRKITTYFNRFTLVDFPKTSRITIDFNLRFAEVERDIMLENLVIFEIKQEKEYANKNIYYLLKEKSIRPCSVSKYCIGLTLMNNLPKANIFKDTIRKINRINHVS